MVLLDEPTRGLDYAAKARARRDPRATSRPTGDAVVVATHDVEFVARVADRVVVLAEGEIVADGPTADVSGRVAGVRAAGRQGPGARAVAHRRRGRAARAGRVTADHDAIEPRAVRRVGRPRSAVVLALASVAGLADVRLAAAASSAAPASRHRTDAPFIFVALLPGR